MEKRTRGRPKLPPGERRSEILLIRMRPADKVKLQAAAKLQGESLTVWLVRTGLKAVKKSERMAG